LKKLRVALVTANVGNFEKDRHWEDQDYICDFYKFHDSSLPFPLPNLNARLKSKYVKIMTHRFLPDYDIYVWVDSSVEIVNDKFVSKMVELLTGNDIVISDHYERSNVYDELEYIKTNIEKGAEYLIKRYGNEPIEEEMTFYKNSHITENHVLFITRFFARRNNKKVNEAFNDWWLKVLEFMNFDQAMFTYIGEKHNLDISCPEYLDIEKDYLIVHKHE